MRFIHILCITIFLVQCAFSEVAFAQQERATAADAQALVERGLDHIKVVGLKRACKDFSTKDGKWSKGELYIFMQDYEGVFIAHGANRALVGRNMNAVKDANGKELVKEFTHVVKTKGRGWVEYLWSNPMTKKIEEKATFVASVPGCACLIGVGYYRSK